MKKLQSFRLSSSFPYESISFYEEMFSGFSFIRNKIVRTKYYQIWVEKYNLRKKIRKPYFDQIKRERINQIEYMLQFSENFKNRLILSKYFLKWKQCFLCFYEDTVSVDPKYVEFMTELQESISHKANLKTTLSVLDKKLNELIDVESQTRTKTETLLRKCDFATSTYESLLKQLSEMKISYRDHISALQMQINNQNSSTLKQNPKNKSDKLIEQISNDQSTFQNNVNSVLDLIKQEKEKAAILRNKIIYLDKENNEKENELQKLSNEIKVLSHAGNDLNASPIQPFDKIVELRKVLLEADQQLKQTSEILQKQNNQIRELDLQIIKDRTTLDELRTPQKTQKSIKTSQNKINV